jgi:hypothetical protein
MSQRSHVVWTWLNSKSEPVYVGWGMNGHYHPAKALWISRNQYDSPLTEFLRTLSREPKRSKDSNHPAMSRIEARGLAMSKRENFRAHGFDLFDDRPYATRCGGGASRKVLGPDLETYDSVRDAAAAIGVNPSSVTRWCQGIDSGWDFLT